MCKIGERTKCGDVGDVQEGLRKALAHILADIYSCPSLGIGLYCVLLNLLSSGTIARSVVPTSLPCIPASAGRTRDRILREKRGYKRTAPVLDSDQPFL